MASEISISSRLKVTNTGAAYDSSQKNMVANQTTNSGGGPGVFLLTTSDTALTLPGVTNAGWAYIQNLDTVNYVEWGPTSGGAIVVAGRLYPGMGHPVSLAPGITLRMRANTASCRVEVRVFEV